MDRLKSKNIYKYFLILLALAFCFLSVGFSSWNIYDSFSIEAIQVEPVCYNSSTGVQYYTIEDALKNASSGQTIYCYIGKNPTIRKSCTIGNNITLCLPFSDTKYNGRQMNAESSNTWFSGELVNNFADSNQINCDKYLKNTVSIGKNVTVTNNGIINIGGVLGSESQGLQGSTTGDFAQIIMNDNSTIINNGAIDCMGYIKERSKNNGSKIINNSSSIVKMPFVFYDYKGGTYTASVYGNDTSKIFPLNCYDFPNIQPVQEYNYKSHLIGYVDLYTNQVTKPVKKGRITVNITIAARHNTDDLEIIGESNSMYNILDSNSKIILKYTPIGDPVFTRVSIENNYYIGSGGYTTIDFYGNNSYIGTSITLNAANDVTYTGSGFGYEAVAELAKGIIEKNLNQTIQTSSIDFPIPWNLSLTFHSGAFQLTNSIKLLGGAKINIENGATFSLVNNGKVNIYDSSSGSALYQDTAFSSYIYPFSKGEGVFINNGNLTISSGTSFGGRITSNSSTGVITVASGSNLNNSTHEGKGSYTINGMSIVFSFNDYSGSPITKNANVLIYNDSLSSEEESTLSVGTYYSNKSINNNFYWTK